jgi:hypothetical protein
MAAHDSSAMIGNVWVMQVECKYVSRRELLRDSIPTAHGYTDMIVAPLAITDGL